MPNIIDVDDQFYGDEEAGNHNNKEGVYKDDHDQASGSGSCRSSSVYGSLGSDSKDVEDYPVLVEEEEEDDVKPEREANSVLGQSTSSPVLVELKTDFVPHLHKPQYSYGIRIHLFNYSK